jgi:hypothetical protein
LVKNKKAIRQLPKVKLLKQQYKKALKENSVEFHDDLEREFLGSVKYLIAQDVGKNTGLSVDGIIYVMDCMGSTDFMVYLNGKVKVVK